MLRLHYMSKQKKIHINLRIPPKENSDMFRLISSLGLDETRTDFITEAIRLRTAQLEANAQR